jgi:hypothetical protein
MPFADTPGALVALRSAPISTLSYLVPVAYHLGMPQKKPESSRWTFHHPSGAKKIKVPKKKNSEVLELGPVVAERVFTVFKRDGSPLRVSVRLGSPFIGRDESPFRRVEVQDGSVLACL